MDVQISCETLNKIKLLFEKLEAPDYVMNNYYADAYINKIKDTSDPEISQLSTAPIMPELVACALSHSENYHISVKVFLTRLLGCASAKELHFIKIYAQIGDYINRCFKNIHSTNMSESLRVAYLEVALSLVKHCSGIMWLIETGVWKDILMLINEKRTIFVVRQVYQFVTKFLWALNDLGDTANMNVALNLILTPIQDIELLNLNVMNDEKETLICKKIQPMCHMLLAIFSEKDRIRTSNRLMNCLISECYIIINIGLILGLLRSDEIILICTRVLFWANLANIFQKKPLVEGVMYTNEDLLQLNVFYYNTLKCLTQKRNAKLIMEFCGACNAIWNVTWKNEMSFLRDNDKIAEMQRQMLFMCFGPLLVWTVEDKSFIDVMQDEIVVQNVRQMMNSAHIEHMMRAVYSFKSILYETSIINAVKYCVKLLSSVKMHLTDEFASFMFQALYFALREFDPDKNCSQGQSRLENLIVMTHILENMLYVVKHYNITWNESVEVLSLYSIVYELLKKPDLPYKFVVVSLNVLAFSVKKFLTPNLSLLVESTPGSAVHEIGSLINVKMNDEHWEVRDSALELLFVCTDISFIKYPPFQKQIIKENLINAAAAIAVNDQEYYVQASALKCLGAASRVPCIWEQLKTEYPNIQEKLVSILQMNSEGIVRKGACNVLCEIYQHVKLPAVAKNKLYEFMVSSALSDFHWEVQISALKFWRIVIQTLLTEQGMLDGTFPPVTFSKESRKIVALNAAEIQRRLLKVLNELSAIGCLTVLVKLLHEESDTEIMELALKISLELIEILEEHKLSGCLQPSSGEPLRVEEISCHIVNDEDNIMDTYMSTTQLPDNVVDDILKLDDLSLLENVNERYTNLQNSESQVRPKIRLLKSASPYLFVLYVKSKDFKSILEQKKKWKEGMRSLSSLLDDILGVYDMNKDINILDCY
ncbi:uncharacterized protein LOC106135277 [Amyelois transitella]|uniref:uncharacterized protein LOC106135277 n=1 Tax=Amyelois transitella TaxID=680683 RepID=UPI00067D0422|nr:uncharacterized protein LOC106135277 [Amyelois transitella]XP_060807727.1 uncharacterized protein LOC106135277 [Amyelois transitella]